MALGIMLIIWAMVTYLLGRGRGVRATRTGQGVDPLGLLLFLTIIILILFALPRAMVDSSWYPDGGEEGTDGGDGPDGVDDEVQGGGFDLLLPIFLVLIVTVSLPLLLRLTRARERPPGELEKVDDVRPQEMAAVSTSIEDMVTGGDVRGAIMATYRRMLMLQSQAGSYPALTAHELASVLVVTFGWPSAPTSSLTRLFEEAKYSHHPLGEMHRQAALVSLRSIEGWLRGEGATVGE
jgi:hypothetical protein